MTLRHYPERHKLWRRGRTTAQATEAIYSATFLGSVAPSERAEPAVDERPQMADQRCSRAAGPGVLKLGVGFPAGQRVTWTTLTDPLRSSAQFVWMPQSRR